MKAKRNTVVCVFAHPDDEAFGPGGTIATLAEKNDVYLLCATKGEAGTHHNPQFQEKISRIREKELLASTKILGIKKVYFLGYEDGALSNNLYHKLAAKIQTHLEKLKPNIVITYEPRGISGHIDHVAVSMVTTYVFYKLKPIKQLWYYCLTQKQRGRMGDYFIYFPPGYRQKEINKIVDVSKMWDVKLQAMYCHDSQIKDVKRILKQRQGLPKEEAFLTLKK